MRKYFLLLMSSLAFISCSDDRTIINETTYVESQEPVVTEKVVERVVERDNSLAHDLVLLSVASNMMSSNNNSPVVVNNYNTTKVENKTIKNTKINNTKINSTKKVKVNQKTIVKSKKPKQVKKVKKVVVKKKR